MSRVVPEYKEEARNRILHAAQAAFSEKGYDQTTMEDIARRLGVSKGAIYLYFTSKEEVFKQLTEMRQAALRQVLKTSLESGDLLESSEMFFDTVVSSEDIYSMNLTFEVISEGARNDLLRQLLLEDYNKRLAILREFLEKQKDKGLIRKDVDINVLALGISALFNGLMIGHILGMGREQIEQAWMGTLRTIYSSPVQASSAGNMN